MTTDDRAAATLPLAAALVCAVADEDQDEIARILADVTDWAALAIVLAGNVDDTRPMTLVVGAASGRNLAETVIAVTAELTGIGPDLIVSERRSQIVIDARHIAMYACWLAGMSYMAIGRAFEKDHATAINAVARVGARPALRAAAHQVAAAVGITRPGDEPDQPGDRRKPTEVKCPGCGTRTRRAVGICNACENTTTGEAA